MSSTDLRAEALAFLTSQKAGVLSTLSKGNEPRGRLMYYAADHEFNVYFLTFANTRKAEDLATFPKAAFTVFDTETPRTLQMEGDAAVITNSPVKDEIIESLFDHLQMNAKYYAPLARFDRADVQFYRFTPSWVRYGNFTHGHTTAEVLTRVV